MFSLDTTIIARGTAHGSALRGVLRLSGNACLDALRGVFYCETDEIWSRCDQLHNPRVFTGFLTPWEPQRKIPCDVYFWPQGRGYTGQKSLELHLWGSEPILDAVQQRILASEYASVRLANPGEFTLRAFLAGRLDLTQAEAVLGIIDATDTDHLDVALKQLAGGVGQPLHDVREELLETLAHLEAGLDFVDEEIDFISQEELVQKIETAIATLQKILKQITTRNLSGKAVRVLFTGAPNVGKSSLYNCLTEKSDHAIVSDVPGTTRDYLETPLCWNGIELSLIDSAGIGVSGQWTVDSGQVLAPSVSAGDSRLRGNDGMHGSEKIETPDDVAQQFSRRILEEADLVLYCSPSPLGEKPVILDAKPTILVFTKCDDFGVWAPPSGDGFLRTVSTSAKTGLGIDALKTAILEWIVNRFGSPEVVPATAVRCRDAVGKAIRSLTTALDLTRQSRDEMFVASELRIALDQLGQVLGVVHTDDLLDRIFSNFCIGK